MAERKEGMLGRDCPICKEPDMGYLGKMGRPIYLVTPNPREETQQLYAEIYRCKVCNHLEWKAID